jgi:hypothetical protein
MLRERCPSSSRRKDMDDGLLKHKIPFSCDLFETELYDLTKFHKTRQKRYILDVLGAHGHVSPFTPVPSRSQRCWRYMMSSSGSDTAIVTFKLDDVWHLYEQQPGEYTECIPLFLGVLWFVWFSTGNIIGRGKKWGRFSKFPSEWWRTLIISPQDMWW